MDFVNEVEKVFITDGITNDIKSFDIKKYNLKSYMVCISADEVPIIEYIRKCIKEKRSFYFSIGV